MKKNGTNQPRKLPFLWIHTAVDKTLDENNGKRHVCDIILLFVLHLLMVSSCGRGKIGSRQTNPITSFPSFNTKITRCIQPSRGQQSTTVGVARQRHPQPLRCERWARITAALWLGVWPETEYGFSRKTSSTHK